MVGVRLKGGLRSPACVSSHIETEAWSADTTPMDHRTTVSCSRRFHWAATFAVLCLVVSCKKKDDAANTDKQPVKESGSKASTKSVKKAPPKAEDEASKLVSQIGVEPGGIAADANDGGEAVLQTKSGSVSIRRVGEEAFVAITKDGIALHAGDQIQTGADAKATIVFVDETVAEIADDTVVAIGDRDSGADPASAAAVMYGVARFSVSDRAAGEGAFLVYTPGGVVGTRGTTYVVGVAAKADARIGVEEGELELAGASAFDKPVALGAGKVATISAQGQVGAGAAFKADDWGQWRESVDASLSPEAIADLQAKRLEVTSTEADTVSLELDAATVAAADASAEAKQHEAAGDTAAYDASAEDRGAAIEASFLLSLRLKHLTYAALAHAFMTRELYLRHPEEGGENLETRV